MNDSERKQSGKGHSTLAGKLFFARNSKALSTSKSTTSLPDLANEAVTRRQVLNLSTAMRRGHSHQANEATSELNEMPRKQLITKRRHSFSSFLNIKHKRALSGDEEEVCRKNASASVATTVTSNVNFSSSTMFGPSRTQNTPPTKKGHRPRSYSEVSYNLPQVERAPPVAITNKTPSYEYYGFVMYLTSFVILGIYLIWAYVPDEILHSLGITYYPNRYWALAIPIWLMTIVWFIFFAFISVNVMNTEPFYSYHCITDEHANIMKMEKELISDRPSDWIPELHDIPIGLVNTFLYQNDLTATYTVNTKESLQKRLF